MLLWTLFLDFRLKLCCTNIPILTTPFILGECFCAKTLVLGQASPGPPLPDKAGRFRNLEEGHSKEECACCVLRTPHMCQGLSLEDKLNLREKTGRRWAGWDQGMGKSIDLNELLGRKKMKRRGERKQDGILSTNVQLDLLWGNWVMGWGHN